MDGVQMTASPGPPNISPRVELAGTDLCRIEIRVTRDPGGSPHTHLRAGWLTPTDIPSGTSGQQMP